MLGLLDILSHNGVDGVFDLILYALVDFLLDLLLQLHSIIKDEIRLV